MNREQRLEALLRGLNDYLGFGDAPSELLDRVDAILAEPAPAQDEREAPAGITPEWVLGYFDTNAPESARNAVRYAFAEYAALAIAAPTAQTEQQPLAWLIDWPEEPELGHYFSDEPNEHARSSPLYAAPIAQAEQRPISRETIRAVFLRNGFTVKEGQTDLKPYVYAAAEELLRLSAAPQRED